MIIETRVSKFNCNCMHSWLLSNYNVVNEKHALCLPFEQTMSRRFPKNLKPNTEVLRRHHFRSDKGVI